MSDPLSDVFRANVRTAMRLRGLNQSALAGLVGLSNHSVNKLLTNPRGTGVTLSTIERYADALGIPADVLITPGEVQRFRVTRMETAA